MPSPRTFIRSRGFSLLEIIVTLGIFAILAALGVVVSLDSFRASSFRSDRDLVVALLQHARAQAVNNICTGTCSGSDGLPHGVHIDQSGRIYTVFQGITVSADPTQNQAFSGNPNVTLQGDADVLFSQLTGAVSAQKQIIVTYSGKTSVITVDTSGRISWTN